MRTRWKQGDPSEACGLTTTARTDGGFAFAAAFAFSPSAAFAPAELEPCSFLAASGCPSFSSSTTLWNSYSFSSWPCVTELMRE